MRKVLARIEATVGDCDGDGRIGVTITAHANLPLDGTDELRHLFTTPELEPPLDEVPDLVQDAARYAMKVVKYLPLPK